MHPEAPMSVIEFLDRNGIVVVPGVDRVDSYGELLDFPSDIGHSATTLVEAKKIYML